MSELNEIMSAPKRSRDSFSCTLVDNLSECRTIDTPRRTSIDSSFKLIQIIEKRFDKQNESIKSLLMECEARLLAEFNKRLDSLTIEFKELGERVQQLETVADEFVAMKSEIMNLQTQLKAQANSSLASGDVVKMKTEINELKIQALAQENSLVASELRLNCIPFYNDENLPALFNSICSSLNISTPHLKSIYRLQNRNNTKKQSSPDAVIIVNFLSPYDKNFFLKCFFDYKKRNGKCLCLNDLGFDSNSPFYINENLSNTNYKLFREAFLLKKQKLIHSAYTFRGLVYVKRCASDEPVCIVHSDSLDGFRHQGV